jgi:hypothetical protein
MARERRSWRFRQVVGTIDRKQDEEEVAPQHHRSQQEHQLMEGDTPARHVPVASDGRNHDNVGQIAEVKELRERDEREALTEVEARLSREQHGFDRGNRLREPPITHRGGQRFHFLVEDREQDDRMPVSRNLKIGDAERYR